MPRDASGHLTAGLLSPERDVPRRIPRPEYVGRREPRADTHGDVYTPAEVELIRESGRIAAGAVEAVGAAIRPGITTDELDAIAHEFVIGHDAYPSTLHYRGYPKS